MDYQTLIDTCIVNELKSPNRIVWYCNLIFNTDKGCKCCEHPIDCEMHYIAKVMLREQAYGM